jgi:hypothetical protein
VQPVIHTKFARETSQYPEIAHINKMKAKKELLNNLKYKMVAATSVLPRIITEGKRIIMKEHFKSTTLEE